MGDNKSNKSKTNSHIEYKNKIKELEDVARTNKMEAQKNQDFFKARMKEVEDENTKLRKVVEIKQNIIDDITQKIQLLEDAIEEHERNLTARDNKVEEYQRR